MEAGPNVQRVEQVLLGSAEVGLMVIGDDGRRLGLGGAPDAAEERPGGGQVPALSKEQVDHPTGIIDSAIEVPLGGAVEEEDLVDVPASAKPATMAPLEPWVKSRWGTTGEALTAGAVETIARVAGWWQVGQVVIALP